MMMAKSKRGRSNWVFSTGTVSTQQREKKNQRSQHLLYLFVLHAKSRGKMFW